MAIPLHGFRGFNSLADGIAFPRKQLRLSGNLIADIADTAVVDRESAHALAGSWIEARSSYRTRALLGIAPHRTNTCSHPVRTAASTTPATRTSSIRAALQPGGVQAHQAKQHAGTKR